MAIARNRSQFQCRVPVPRSGREREVNLDREAECSQPIPPPGRTGAGNLAGRLRPDARLPGPPRRRGPDAPLGAAGHGGRPAPEHGTAEARPHIRGVTFGRNTPASRTGGGPSNPATIRPAIIAAIRDPGHLHAPEKRPDRTASAGALCLHGQPRATPQPRPRDVRRAQPSNKISYEAARYPRPLH